jgi:hypothetical protein
LVGNEGNHGSFQVNDSCFILCDPDVALIVLTKG